MKNQTTHRYPARRNSTLSISNKRIPRRVAVALMAASAAGVASASEPEFLDSLWSRATLHKDDANPILQEFKLRGRYHGQYHHADADSGTDSGWEDRRSRLGLDAKLFNKKIELRADFQSNDGFRDIYDGLVDAYARWRPTKTLAITAGKTKPLIGQYDWLESTNSQPTFERSQIFNQLNVNRATALTVEHSIGAFSWRAGIYNNDTPATTGGTGSWGDGEFGDFDGGVSYSLGIGYDLKSKLGFEQAGVWFDWLHSERKPGDRILGRYDDIISATFLVKEGPAALVVEGYHATGGNGIYSKLFGFFVQPTYDLVPGKFQLVGRYTYSRSDGPTGVRPQGRYEFPAGALRGDTYHAIYLGGQYFIHGDKLKLMAGTEYAALGQSSTSDRYDGYTFLTGLRLSF
jgi:phosphate-selective porin OprO and OprP